MSCFISLKLLSFVVASVFVARVRADVADNFQKPVFARIYNGEQYSLANMDRSTGDRVNISGVASAIAGLRPTYVCSLIYLGNGDNLTDTMVNDFNVVRSAVRAVSPTAKFDIEISLQADPPKGNPFPNAAALVSFMQHIDSELQLDGWWFDFYSDAQKTSPDWISSAAEYAHGKNQTIGGNVFGNVVPPLSDAVSFVDNPDVNSTYGFGFSTNEINALKSSSPSTPILGHLQSNPQNGNTTESCVYMNVWNATRRAYYQDYWVSQQSILGFTYMFPVFFPVCPGAYSFDPLNDSLMDGEALPLANGSVTRNSATLYDYIQALALSDRTGDNATSVGAAASSTVAAASSTSAHTSAVTHTNNSARSPNLHSAVLAAVMGLTTYLWTHMCMTIS